MDMCKYTHLHSPTSAVQLSNNIMTSGTQDSGVLHHKIFMGMQTYTKM